MTECYCHLKFREGAEAIYDQSNATDLLIVIDWDRHRDGTFPGNGKRICRAVASRSKGQSFQANFFS